MNEVTEEFRFPSKREAETKKNDPARETGHNWAVELRRHKSMEERQNQISPMNARLIISTAEFFELIGNKDRVPEKLKEKAAEIIIDLERYKLDEERQGQWSPANNSLILRITEWVRSS